MERLGYASGESGTQEIASKVKNIKLLIRPFPLISGGCDVGSVLRCNMVLNGMLKSGYGRKPKRGLGLRKALKITHKALLINMLNFADCKKNTIFEVNKAIKGNVTRRGNKGIGEDGSVRVHFSAL